MKFKVMDILLDCKKIDTPESFIRLIDMVVDLCREDVRRIVWSKGLYFPDFDWIYKESADMTLETFKKSHLRTIKRFLKCDDINEMTRIFIQRIISNMRNISLDPRYREHVSISFVELYDALMPIMIDQDFEVLIDELYQLDRRTLLQGLQQVWKDALEDFDFDEIDFRELCEKFGFSIKEVMGDTLLLKSEQTVGGNRQLVLFF